MEVNLITSSGDHKTRLNYNKTLGLTTNTYNQRSFLFSLTGYACNQTNDEISLIVVGYKVIIAHISGYRQQNAP